MILLIAEIERLTENIEYHAVARKAYLTEVNRSEPGTARSEISKFMLKKHEQEMLSINKELERIHDFNREMVKKYGLKFLENMSKDEIELVIRPEVKKFFEETQ